MNREFIQIPHEISDLLIAKIKNIGREMFLYFIGGCLSLFVLIFIMDSFSKTIRFTVAFITGLFLWLPVIGGFLEKKNILADLKSGEMYIIKKFTKTNSGYQINGKYYEPIIENINNAKVLYILPISRYIAGFE